MEEVKTEQIYYFMLFTVTVHSDVKCAFKIELWNLESPGKLALCNSPNLQHSKSSCVVSGGKEVFNSGYLLSTLCHLTMTWCWFRSWQNLKQEWQYDNCFHRWKYSSSTAIWICDNWKVKRVENYEMELKGTINDTHISTLIVDRNAVSKLECDYTTFLCISLNIHHIKNVPNKSCRY